MIIEKVKKKARIVFTNKTVLVGLIHIDQGLRAADYLNDHKDNFIPVTLQKSNRVILVNKLNIISIEEL